MIERMCIAVPRETLPRPSDEKMQNFERVTGIKSTRRWNKTTVSLAKRAVMGLGALPDVDQVIVVTQSPDRFSPCMAVEIASLIGRTMIPAFDVNQSCCGFLYGLALCTSLNTLLVCVDRLRMPPGSMDDYIFSDAACAALVRRVELPIYFENDPMGLPYLYWKTDGAIHMDGSAVFDKMANWIPKTIQENERGRGVPSDLLVQHQANLALMRTIDIRSRFVGRSLYSIGKYGNQSMVSIPTAIAANEKDCLGKKLLLCGYGAGWSMALAQVEWPENEVCSIVEV